jgi:crossover junction endodeoxyribonuclease RusA
MELELPMPPSANRLWRRVGNRTLLSRDGRNYRVRVQEILAARGVQLLEGRLAVAIDVYPPDRRRRDLDNLHKGLLDSLQHGGVFRDDEQIDDLHIRRCGCIPGGMVRVRLTSLAESEPEPEPESQVKPRSCLKCSKTFDSTGPWNRICTPCHKKNDKFGISESELQAQRGVKRRNGELMPSGIDDC